MLCAATRHQKPAKEKTPKALAWKRGGTPNKGKVWDVPKREEKARGREGVGVSKGGRGLLVGCTRDLRGGLFN